MAALILEPWQRTFETDTVAKYEGCVSFLYLDTRGLVTVGRGCQVSCQEAQSLLFLKDGRPATQAEIMQDYSRVFYTQAGHLAAFYSQPGAPYLPEAEIEALVARRIQSATTLLRFMFPAFNSWPDPAKIATLEMPWGVGESKFQHEWPNFRAALARKDWRAAAKDCSWSDPTHIYAARNAARIALYQQAAQL